MADDMPPPPPPSQSAPALSGPASANPPSSTQAPPPSDSAPPPSFAPPAPPARPTWSMPSNTNAAAPPPSPPPMYAPNSIVPKFIHALAILVFVIGGTTAAATTWFYKSIIYPRLVLALQARTKLHQKQLGLYTTLVDEGVKRLLEGKGGKLLRSGKAEGEATADGEKVKEGDDEKTKATATASSESGSSSSASASDDEKAPLLSQPNVEPSSETDPDAPSAVVLPPPALVLAPLQASLSSLKSALPSDSPNKRATTLPSTLPTLDSPSPFPFPTPSISLVSSLQKLNSYIETETYSVITSTSSTYRFNASAGQITGAEGSGGKKSDRQAVLDAVQGLKAEIRGVKGALLNRRNFAALAPRGGAGAVTA